MYRASGGETYHPEPRQMRTEADAHSSEGKALFFFNKQIRQPALIFLPHKSMNFAFHCQHPQGLESLLGIIALFAEELLQLQ